MGGVFLASFFSKVLKPYQFLEQVYGYEMVGERWGVLTAFFIPWLEMMLAFFLLAGIALEGAFFLSALLMLLFSLVQSFALYRGLDISCGCFSATESQSPISMVSTIRTVALFLLCVLGGMLRARTNESRRRSEAALVD